MTWDEFKNIVRGCFIVFTALVYIIWIADILSGNYGDFIEFILSLAISGFCIYYIIKDAHERSYPHKYFAISLGMFNLLGYAVWIGIRPKKFCKIFDSK